LVSGIFTGGGAHAGYRRRYLPDVPWPKIPELLTTHGLSEPQSQELSEWVLEAAAVIRLAHASLVNTLETESLSGAPPGTLSRTAYTLQRGRPKTARWAFWTSFLFRQRVKINEQVPTHKLLADLIGVLLSPRKVSPEEVRTEFVRMRRETEKCAVLAAEVFLETTLRASMSERAFSRTTKI
jgi:hypothetical protein